MPCCPRIFVPFAVLVAGLLVLSLKQDSPAARPAKAEVSMFGVDASRNLVNTIDKNIPTEWSVEEGKPTKNVKWVAKLGDTGYAGAAVAQGKVFVATNNRKPRDPKVTGDKGIIMCFRESDGQFLWQAVHDNPDEDIIKRDGAVIGIVSTPTVEGNRLYYVNNRCEVVCADANGLAQGADEKGNPKAEAKIVWRLDMVKQLDVFPHKLANCSPLLVGDLLFITTGNGVDEQGEQVRSPKAPSFIAINKNTGKVVWQDNSPGEAIVWGQWSSPAYGEVKGKGQVIFGGGDGWLRAFEPQTGKLIWKFDCNPRAEKGKRGKPNYLVSTPVVYDNKVYVGVGQQPDVGTGMGHFWCIDITKTGDLTPVGDSFDPKAPGNQNCGVVWHFGGPAAPGGERDYNFGRTASSCAIHDGLLYISEVAGFLYCLDANTGKKYWEHDLKAEVWGSPYWVDGKVYLGTGDGDVHILAHGKEKKLIGKIEMGEAIYTTPLAANGVLYIVTMKNLYAIATK